MQCPNCGQDNEQDVKFCPNCGTAQASANAPVLSAAPEPAPIPVPVVQPEPAQPSQETLKAERTAYVRQDYNPVRDGRLGVPVQPAAPGSAPNPYQAVQRPSTTGMVVFAIVNMLCCGLGVGFILGVIALIFAIMSSSEPLYEEARRRLATARTLNMIGLVFIILQVVVFFGAIILAVVFAGDFGAYSFR